MEKDWNWITLHNDLGVKMINQSDEMSLLAIQGPLAAQAMQTLTDIDLKNMEYYSFKIGTFAGFDPIIVSATVIQEVVVLKFISPMQRLNLFGRLFSKRVNPTISNLQDWHQEIL